MSSDFFTLTKTNRGTGEVTTQLVTRSQMPSTLRKHSDRASNRWKYRDSPGYLRAGADPEQFTATWGPWVKVSGEKVQKFSLTVEFAADPTQPRQVPTADLVHHQGPGATTADCGDLMGTATTNGEVTCPACLGC